MCILLFSGVTLFEYNVSTILLAIVGYYILLTELFSILRIKIMFPLPACIAKYRVLFTWPSFQEETGIQVLPWFFLRPQIAVCPLKRMRVLAKYQVADFRQIHFLEARSP